MNKVIHIISLIILLICLPVRATDDLDDLKQQAWNWLDNEYERLDSTNRKIWSYAETSLQESRSSEQLLGLLRKNGFNVKVGVAGMPTAFVASYGHASPVIGILAEFDALPGLSQAANPTPGPGPNPAAGHACGHSIYGVGSVAAAIAIKRLIEAGLILGTVRLYGTPAEETAIGKVYMLRDDYFKQDDVILKWHAYHKTQADYMHTKAMVNVKFRFKGKASHASARPFDGRSALDAVELLNIGVNYMREHIKEDARIHYVITNGGDQPNVVPPVAEVWYYIRANTFNDVTTYFERVKDIAKGAQLMSGTRLEAIEVQSEIHEMLPIRTLVELMHNNLEKAGPPKWNKSEIEFARNTQIEFRKNSNRPYVKGSTALSTTIEALPDRPRAALASTDTGDVSWFVPTGGLTVASYAYDLPIHSWPVVAATGTSIGSKALTLASKVIAATAIDLYMKPNLLARTKADFRKAREQKQWQTLIPEQQRAPQKVR
jgi:aminobenzoyl-glutamate utilization protein B